jgi:hypothetical protein
MRLGLPPITDVALFAALGLVTISWASTTVASVEIFAAVRLALIGVLASLSLVKTVKRRSQSSIALSALALTTFAGVYSIAALGIRSPSGPLLEAGHVAWIVLTAAIAVNLLLNEPRRALIGRGVAKSYVAMSASVLALTALIGGLVIDGYPRFNYEISTIERSAITYSQGISKFYGLGALFCAGLVTDARSSRPERMVYSVLLVLFLFLSLLGGGRGDFIVSVALTVFRLRAIYGGVVFSVCAITIFSFKPAWDGLIPAFANLWDRYLALTYSYGMRDELLTDSITLLANEPLCLLLGCGVGFFQFYHNYPAGLYPHNIPVEVIISYGVLITMLLLFAALKGLSVVRNREGRDSHFTFVLAFFFLVSLKSGTVLTAYVLSGAITFLAIVGIQSVGRVVHVSRVRTNVE